VASKEDVKLAAELKALTQQRVDLEKQIVEQKSKMESAEKKINRKYQKIGNIRSTSYGFRGEGRRSAQKTSKV
jgi:predicted  nucleic acid-binding Zn-ribbon protein